MVILARPRDTVTMHWAMVGRESKTRVARWKRRIQGRQRDP